MLLCIKYNFENLGTTFKNRNANTVILLQSRASPKGRNEISAYGTILKHEDESDLNCAFGKIKLVFRKFKVIIFGKLILN